MKVIDVGINAARAAENIARSETPSAEIHTDRVSKHPRRRGACGVFESLVKRNR